METEKVGILLVEGYPLIPFSCVLEVLRTANRLSNSDLFEWEFCAPNTESVTSNSGIMVPMIPLSDARDLQTLVICAPADAHTFDDAKTLNLLKNINLTENFVPLPNADQWIRPPASVQQN